MLLYGKLSADAVNL